MSLPTVSTEAELLTTVGDIVAEYVEKAVRDRSQTDDNVVRELQHQLNGTHEAWRIAQDQKELLDRKLCEQIEENERMRLAYVDANNRYTNLCGLIFSVARGYKLEHFNSVEDALSKAEIAAKRKGHDEGFLFGLRSALDIIVKHGNPTSAEVSKIIADFEANREQT